MSKVSPTAGLKPLIKVTFRVPSRVAAPVTASRSYCVPAVVPPISMFSDPPGLCAAADGRRGAAAAGVSVDCQRIGGAAGGQVQIRCRAGGGDRAAAGGATHAFQLAVLVERDVTVDAHALELERAAVVHVHRR